MGLINGSVMPSVARNHRDTLRPAVVDRNPNTASGLMSGQLVELDGTCPVIKKPFGDQCGVQRHGSATVRISRGFAV